MQSFFEDRAKGIKLLQTKVRELATAHAQRLGLNLRVEPNYIVQAYDAAFSSANFHNIEMEKLSHKKELAHLGYWIAELKPVTITPPVTIETMKRDAIAMGRELAEGNLATLTEYDKSKSAIGRRYVASSTFPLSETVGLELIAHFLQAEFLQKLEKAKGDKYREMLLEQNHNFKEILYDSKVFDHIVKALRFHIFTPRAFATLIESVFAFEGSPQAATDDE